MYSARLPPTGVVRGSHGKRSDVSEPRRITSTDLKAEPVAAGQGKSATRAHWQTRTGAYTLHYHYRYSLLEGIQNGVFFPIALSYIMLGLLGDSASESEKKLYSTLIYWLPTLVMLFAPIWGQTRASGKRYWIWAAWGARLVPGLLFAFVTEAWQVVALITMMAFMGSGVAPAQNAVFHRNYAAYERDRYHSATRRWQIIVIVISNLALMFTMDYWHDAYRVVLPLGGLAGAIAMLLMYRVRLRRPEALARAARSSASRRSRRVPIPLDASQPVMGPLRAWRSVRAFAALKAITEPYPAAWKLYKRNKPFLVFEIGFMVYGMAFMMLLPVISVFYKNVFDVDYSMYSLHTMLAFQAVLFISHLLMRGRTARWSAPRLALTAYVMLILYPTLLLVSAETVTLWVAFVGFLIYGGAMALVEYAWNYGPLQFAGRGDPMPYLRTHAMMVGLRGMIAYPIAYVILENSAKDDFVWSLSIPIALFVCAALIAGGLLLAHRRGMPLTEKGVG